MKTSSGKQKSSKDSIQSKQNPAHFPQMSQETFRGVVFSLTPRCRKLAESLCMGPIMEGRRRQFFVLLLLLGCTHVAASWLAMPLGKSAKVHGPRRRALVRLSESQAIPPEAVDKIPPGQLADAWGRDEKAKELSEKLKGCSLWIVGLGPKKTAVGRVLARRLTRYRCYDINALMISTYQQLSAGAEPVTLAKLVASEPLGNVEQLAAAIMQQVQAYSRSVFITWDGAISTRDYSIMQQGLVVHLEQESPENVALPADGADDALNRWKDGHRMADVTVSIAPTDAADDVVLKVGNPKCQPAPYSRRPSEMSAIVFADCRFRCHIHRQESGKEPAVEGASGCKARCAGGWRVGEDQHQRQWKRQSSSSKALKRASHAHADNLIADASSEACPAFRSRAL